MKPFTLALSAFVYLASISDATAQSPAGRFDASVHVIALHSTEFDRADIGVGGRLGWRPIDLVSVEGELNGNPRNFPDSVPFSSSRVEGLFGGTVGPWKDRVRPFAKFRAGFVDFRPAPEPIACILIFPPPLSCTLASGRMLFAMDIGGGAEISLTPKTFVRVDGGDRIVKYPGPVFDSARTVQQNGFASHDMRFSFGGGVRF